MTELNTIAIMDKIIVKLLKVEEEMTKGGLIVPEIARDQLKPQSYGEVLSTGELVNEIKVEDVIMFNKHAGMDIILDQNVCKVLKYDEVYGIVSRKAGD